MRNLQLRSLITFELSWHVTWYETFLSLRFQRNSMVQVDNKEGGARIYGTITNIGNQEVSSVKVCVKYLYPFFNNMLWALRKDHYTHFPIHSPAAVCLTMQVDIFWRCWLFSPISGVLGICIYSLTGWRVLVEGLEPAVFWQRFVTVKQVCFRICP